MNRRPHERISTAHVQTDTMVLLLQNRHTVMVFLGFSVYTGYVFKPLTVLPVTVFTGYRLYRYNGLKINLESLGGSNRMLTKPKAPTNRPYGGESQLWTSVVLADSIRS